MKVTTYEYSKMLVMAFDHVVRTWNDLFPPILSYFSKAPTRKPTPTGGIAW
jgi:hypothetical protein